MDNRLKEQDLPLLQECAQTLRFLSADMVQRANSGHPGVAMGLAEVGVVLGRHVRLNPSNPHWLNRDRLVFSGGHASAFVYALLHLWGFDLNLEDLKAFRQLDSKTPGHLEFKHTPGVEITTGPLGQGFANAVGFALGAKIAQNLLDSTSISHKVYCLCGDGDLQEGISYESASLAGHLGLDNLIVIYDSNAITIEGDTNLAFSENVRERFKAQNWEVLEGDGHNFLEIDRLLTRAQATTKPTLIIAKTTIGKGALGLEGSAKVHGAPLGAEVLARSKEALGLSGDFVISERVAHALNMQEKGQRLELEWQSYLESQPDLKARIAHLQAKDFSKVQYPTFEAGKMIATRASNGAILNALSEAYLGFLGGSADLAPSNNTHLKDQADCLPPHFGRNLHFGIREHAMGAMSNALANYGLFVPFCATFFVFSDYVAPSLRLSALMGNQIFYIFTHDSIGVGEDGPTHQPIEQLSHLRALPNFYVFRPMDAHENVRCWQVALSLNKPCAFVLSRQNLPVHPNMPLESVQKGGYVVHAHPNPQITLVSSGSEVSPCLEAVQILQNQGVGVQVVSVPCFDLLLEQDKTYLKSLFKGKVLAVEAGRGLEWGRFAHDVLGMESFGKSAPGGVLFDHFGFSAQNIAKRACTLVEESC
ncbi:transketolase [Helicobacter felis]|uniref:Transketolase n=1 Tax=Helicobacter felis (strain ATCC 49179 / CCUG 28539 / NCTC 12436 / CS1) TaxID=936155 RepID=E7A8T2_HELFC|nr:transketolase [Helicobacter felis]CBY83213.1 transketolase [Helicobacter felis ATCC 49179]